MTARAVTAFFLRCGARYEIDLVRAAGELGLTGFNLIGDIVLFEVDGGSIVTLPGDKSSVLKSAIAKLHQVEDVLTCY